MLSNYKNRKEDKTVSHPLFVIPKGYYSTMVISSMRCLAPANLSMMNST